jgi:hypothetical protein
MSYVCMIVTVDDPLARTDLFCDWLVDHDLQPDRTYKVVVRDDGKVFAGQFSLNDEGRKFVNEIGEAATEIAERKLIRPVPDRKEALKAHMSPPRDPGKPSRIG